MPITEDQVRELIEEGAGDTKGNSPSGETLDDDNNRQLLEQLVDPEQSKLMDEATVATLMQRITQYEDYRSEYLRLRLEHYRGTTRGELDEKL